MPNLFVYTPHAPASLINDLCSIQDTTVSLYKSNLHIKYLEISPITPILLDFLYRRITATHPVYKYSPKLTSLATTITQSPIHQHNLRQLQDFLSQHKEINIDSYITFRLDHYVEKLDTILYQLVPRTDLFFARQGL